MSDAVIAAVIAAGASVLGSYLTGRKSAKDIDHKLDVQQAVMRTQIEELTREVREHNNFARRVPVLEEQVKVANHRIEDLEGFHKHA